MNVLLIDGHPDRQSLCAGLSESYVDGARDAGHHIERTNVRELVFSPNIMHGYRARTEPDLVAAQQAITRAEHLVFVFPTWWDAMPGHSKGFLDRVLLPGFAFRGYAARSPSRRRMCEGLLEAVLRCPAELRHEPLT